MLFAYILWYFIVFRFMLVVASSQNLFYVIVVCSFHLFDFISPHRFPPSYFMKFYCVGFSDKSFFWLSFLRLAFSFCYCFLLHVLPFLCYCMFVPCIFFAWMLAYSLMFLNVSVIVWYCMSLQFLLLLLWSFMFSHFMIVPFS